MRTTKMTPEQVRMSPIIGIDPGLDGAICILDGDYLTIRDMPTVEQVVSHKVRRMIDPHTFRDIVIDAGPVSMVVIEKPATRPGESPIGALSYGIGFGQMIGVLVALERPHITVRPQVWTRALDVGADKDVHRHNAMGVFSAQRDLFKRKKDDGRADAALIAYYWLHFGDGAGR